MKPIRYITIIVFALISVCMGVLFGGCKSRNAVQWVHDKNGVWHPQTNVTDSSVDFPYAIDGEHCGNSPVWFKDSIDVVTGKEILGPHLPCLKHDTVFIHDTIYRSKITHINH